MESNRLEILKKVENGEIPLEVASELLADFEQSGEINESILPPTYRLDDSDVSKPEKIKKPAWANIFWIIPLFLGVLLSIFSSTWLYQNYESSGLGFKFWLTWIPFLIGVFLIYLGWSLQKAKWIHVNIKQPEGKSPRRIFIALPLPLQFLGFFLKIFKGKITSGPANFDFEELMDTIEKQITKDEPLFVDVNDEDGTKVEVYIG